MLFAMGISRASSIDFLGSSQVDQGDLALFWVTAFGGSEKIGTEMHVWLSAQEATLEQLLTADSGVSRAAESAPSNLFDVSQLPSISAVEWQCASVGARRTAQVTRQASKPGQLQLIELNRCSPSTSTTHGTYL
jgi:hypothetical protein